METQPALSPDGNQVAYCWIPEGRETADIYVKVIGSGEPLRRTTRNLSTTLRHLPA